MPSFRPYRSRRAGTPPFLPRHGDVDYPSYEDALPESLNKPGDPILTLESDSGQGLDNETDIHQAELNDPLNKTVTVTPEGISDRYKRMMQDGPDKPGIWNKLKAAGVTFAGAMSRSDRRMPGMDYGAEQGLREEALYPGWKDRISRAKEMVAADERDQEQKFKEEQLKGQRDDRAFQRDTTRRHYDQMSSDRQDALDQRKEYASQKEAIELQNDGWLPIREGQQAQEDPSTEQIKDTHGRVWYRRSYTIPDPVRKYLQDKGFPVPTGSIREKELNNYSTIYRDLLNQDRFDEDRKAREQAEKNRDDRSERQLGIMDRRADAYERGIDTRLNKPDDRDRNRQEKDQREELFKAESVFSSRLNDLRKEFARDNKGEGDLEFQKRKQNLLNELVDSKNRIYQSFSNPHRDDYIDVRTNKVVKKDTNSQTDEKVVSLKKYMTDNKIPPENAAKTKQWLESQQWKVIN